MRSRVSASSTIGLSVSVAVMSATSVGQTIYPEVEPNDSRLTANVFDQVVAGDTFVGSTTVSTGSGPGSADYFRIRTATAPLGIYAHRLRAVVANHERYILLPAFATCVQLDFAAEQNSTAPYQYDFIWYGFGRSEELSWAMHGSASLSSYVLALETEPVRPLEVVPPVPPGSIQFGSEHISCVRVFFDRFLRPLSPGPQVGHPLVRTFPEGTYYVALGGQLTTSSFCPSVWTNLNSRAFPGGLLSRWDGGYSVAENVTYPGGQTTITLPGRAWEVVWLKLRVFEPNTCGSDDYDGDGDSATDDDIREFFACLSGECCMSCDPRGSDFNGDGDQGTDQDIEAFFRVLSGANC